MVSAVKQLSVTKKKLRLSNVEKCSIKIYVMPGYNIELINIGEKVIW